MDKKLHHREPVPKMCKYVALVLKCLKLRMLDHNATVEDDACLTASLTQQTPDKAINIYKIPLFTLTNLSCFSKHR